MIKISQSPLHVINGSSIDVVNKKIDSFIDSLSLKYYYYGMAISSRAKLIDNQIELETTFGRGYGKLLYVFFGLILLIILSFLTSAEGRNFIIETPSYGLTFIFLMLVFVTAIYAMGRSLHGKVQEFLFKEFRLEGDKGSD